MTPNPHRGSDFNDFLAEEGLTPTMTPTSDLPDQLREYNRWRRGGEGWHPNPSKIGKMLDAAADCLEELERVRQTLSDCADYLNRRLREERALADRLASALTDSATWNHALPAYEAWKEARTPVGYNPSPSEAEIDAHLNECVAKSALSWKPLPGDEP